MDFARHFKVESSNFYSFIYFFESKIAFNAIIALFYL